MEDYSHRDKRKYFSSGWIGGVCIVILYLVAWIVDLPIMDWSILVVSIPIYFFIARSAAEKRVQDQQANPDPLDGVRSTGMGAVIIALTISCIVLILKEVLGRQNSIQDLIFPVLLCVKLPLQIGIALAAGSFSSNVVVKHNKFDDLD